MRKLVSMSLMLLMLCLAGCSASPSKATLQSIEMQQKSISEASLKTKTIVFFYRDDCPDCQRVFDQVYRAKQTGTPIIFANTNNPKNRKLALLNGVKTVPSFVYQGHIYKTLTATKEAR